MRLACTPTGTGTPRRVHPASRTERSHSSNSAPSRCARPFPRRAPGSEQGAQASLPYVSVNLSARQFHDPGLLSMIEGSAHGGGLAPKRLLLEVTESVALADVVGTTSVIEHLDRSE